MSHRCSRYFWDRREFLFKSGGGISGVALAWLLDRDRLLSAAPPGPEACSATAVGVNPYAPKAPHFTPRATAVISLFMGGGWSQMDTFDPKPALTKYAGQPIDDKVKGDVIVRQGSPGPLMPSPFTFRKYGQSGIEVSEIFPFLSRHVDDFAFLRSVYGRSNDHVQGTYEMQTGQINLGFPSVGSWVTYGLGSESSSLPAFVVMTDARGGPLGGPNDWSAGYMPAAYQGTLFRSSGDPIVDLKPPAGVTPEDQRLRLDADGPAREWATLIGPKNRRVWVGTDIPDVEIPGQNKTDRVVFRDAATGQELARSASLPAMTQGSAIQPGYGGSVFFPGATGTLVKVTPSPK